MIFNRSLFYSLTGALCVLISPPSQAETLREAVAAALASHPGVDIAKARKDVASEGENEAFSALFPEVNAGFTGGRMFGNNSTTRGLAVSRGEAYSWLWEGNASLTQPLFNGFQTYNRIDAAQAREVAAEFTLADAQQGIALHAAQSFLNVMRAQEAHKKTVSYQDRIKDYLSRINGMVEAGAADDSEVAQAKNIQSMLENSVAEMEGQVKLALADYTEAVGSMPSGELRNPELGNGVLFKDMAEAISYASTNHPILLSSKKTMEAEDEEVDAEVGALFPTLDGEVSYLERDQKEEIGGELTDARAVMRMNWAFETGGGQIARIRKSKAERSEAMARTAQTQREIERDIRRAYAELETAKKQKDLYAKRATVTKELFNTYEQQFEASKVRLLQLMQAENQLFTTELEQINANYRVLMAEYGILASAGTLIDALNAASVQTVKSKPVPAEAVASVDAAPVPEAVYPKTEIKSAPPAGK